VPRPEGRGVIMRYELFGTLNQVGGRAVCDLDDEGPEGLEWPLVGPVCGRIALTNTGSSINAHGYLKTVMRMECSRCLQPVEVPLDIEVNEECALAQIDSPQPPAGDQIPLLDEATVDLSELVRQMLGLHTPLRVLCAPDCKGLCPHCGADLNRGKCNCKQDDIDPRLMPLKQLTGQ